MNFTTADLCDKFEERLVSEQLRVVQPMFQSFGGRRTFAGPIATLRVHEDNSLVRKALEHSGNSRILVIDGGGSLKRALLGDQLATLAVKNNWSGIVVYGCLRDSAAIAGMDLGVLALSVHPRKTDKKNTGEIDVPITFGSVTFHAGEWLYADGDGVLVSAHKLD